MTAPSSKSPDALDGARVAELNELLRLDHDAIQSYTHAIRALTNVGRRETLIRFRGDHERHIAELTAGIRRHGGTPADLQQGAAGAGPLELAMQEAGTNGGGDREVLRAFRANARRSRDRYAAIAERADQLPTDLRSALRHAADEESLHYDWATEQLDGLGGLGPRARVAAAVGRVQAGASAQVERAARAGRRGLESARREATHGLDAARRGAGRGVEVARERAGRGMEAARRGAGRGAELAREGAARVRERVPEQVNRRNLGVALASAGVAFLVVTLLDGSRRRR